MLYNKEMMKPNSLTYMLGDGTLRSGIELVARSNIELIPLGEYNRWLKAEWGIHSTTKANQSEAVFRAKDLDARDKEYMRDFCAEDIALYDLIIKTHQNGGGLKVYGREFIQETAI